MESKVKDEEKANAIKSNSLNCNDKSDKAVRACNNRAFTAFRYVMIYP
jgi:hypothetical protein